MRVPCHKQLRRIGKERRAYAEIIVAGIAPNMLDEHIHILHLESVQLTIHQSEVSPIAVAAYSPERTEGSEPLSHLNTADVTCMPDLIAGLKVVQILIVPIAVRIAQDANLLHNSNRLRINVAMIFSVSSNPSMLASIQKS